jgi:hypothetical protein
MEISSALVFRLWGTIPGARGEAQCAFAVMWGRLLTCGRLKILLIGLPGTDANHRHAAPQFVAARNETRI